MTTTEMKMKGRESILACSKFDNGFDAFEGRTEQNSSTMRKIGDHISRVISQVVYPGSRGFLLFLIGKFCDANRFFNFLFIGTKL